MKTLTLRVTALLLIFVLGAGLLASCGNKQGATLGEENASFSEVFLAEPDVGFDKGYRTHTLLSLPEEMSDVQSGGGFFSYYDVADSVYRVYSLTLDRTVLTIPESELADASDISLYEEYFSVVYTKSEEETAVYGRDGSLWATVSGRESLRIGKGKDCFVLGDTLYRVKDGSVTEKYAVPALFSLSDSFALTDSCSICYTARGAVFYNEKFERIALYEVPRVATDFDVAPLSSGKIFVTYTVQCDAASDDYDFFVPSGYSAYQEKVKSYNLIFDPATGKESLLDLGDVAPIDIYNEYYSPFGQIAFYDVVTDTVESILGYYLVEDGQLDRSQVHYVLMDNDGNIGKSLDHLVEDQRGLPMPLNESTYRVQTAAGYAFLDGTGKTLGHMSTTYASSVLTAKDYGFLRNEYDYTANEYVYSVYGKDLAFAFTLRSADVLDRSCDTDGILLYERTAGDGVHYYRYTGEGEVRLTAPAGFRLDEDYYSEVAELFGNGYMLHLIEDTEEYYSAVRAYYSYEGTLLFMGIGSAQILVENDDAAIVRYTTREGDAVYARLAK